MKNNKYSHIHQGLPGQHIDGFVNVGVNLDSHGRRTSAKKDTANTHRTAKHHQKTLQKSKTLHRSSVAKPKARPKVINDTLIEKSRFSDQARIARAQKSQQSPLIGKFATKVQSIEARTASFKPAVYHNSVQQKHNSSHSTLARNATHKRPARPLSKKRRWPSISKMSVALPSLAIALLISGFVAYQRVPQISMRVAASQAGFNAKLPDLPQNFAVSGPVKYQDGRITISFNSGNQQANLHQKPSLLDSASLKRSYLDSRKITYQTYQEQGRTIYIYNGSQATWVNGGIWYSLEGNTSLNNQQIIDIATSI